MLSLKQAKLKFLRVFSEPSQVDLAVEINDLCDSARTLGAYFTHRCQEEHTSTWSSQRVVDEKKLIAEHLFCIQIMPSSQFKI